MTHQQKETIIQMRREGVSYSKISLALGISENTVKSFCRRKQISGGRTAGRRKDSKNPTACKKCGSPLIPTVKGQPKKFCSEVCRRAWWKANENKLVKKAYYVIVCAECGKDFESYGNKSRKFCGHACYIKNRFGKAGDCHDAGSV